MKRQTKGISLVEGEPSLSDQITTHSVDTYYIFPLNFLLLSGFMIFKTPKIRIMNQPENSQLRFFSIHRSRNIHSGLNFLIFVSYMTEFPDLLTVGKLKIFF